MFSGKLRSGKLPLPNMLVSYIRQQALGHLASMAYTWLRAVDGRRIVATREGDDLSIEFYQNGLLITDPFTDNPKETSHE